MKSLKFYRCKLCGNVIAKLVDNNVPVFCCGEIMEELVANTVDAATEKHLPVVNIKNGLVTVKVGSVAHPMEQAHYINFVAIQTNKGYLVATLLPGELPETTVYVGNAKVVAVYEYCNMHGLWETEVK